jgi:hypothetical protein
MIRLETRNYRIEECHNTPCRFALDHKERRPDGTVCLNNLGWFNCYQHATEAMAEHIESNFTLANDPAPHRPAQFENAEPRRQRVCVEGMDLLPGQMDLF